MNNDLISRSALLEKNVFVMEWEGSTPFNAVPEVDILKAPAVDRWIPVEEGKPKDFVSVLGHMTDAGEFPSVRECYVIDGQHFFFPALNEVHPVDKWMNMPEVD